jgi:hypothetical protein
MELNNVMKIHVPYIAFEYFKSKLYDLFQYVFRGQLPLPHNIVMELNNVMKTHVPYIAF